MATMTLSDMRFESYSSKIAILITSSGTYTLDNCYFDGSGTYEIEIDSGVTGDTVIVLQNGTTALVLGDIDNNGSGSVSIINAKTVSVHVEDSSGSNVQGAQCYINKEPSTIYYSSTGNTAGDADLVVSAAIDTDTPSTGWVLVNDVSLGMVFNYQYVSWTGSTFTFKSQVTFNCTGGGTSTSLQDTVNNFTSIDIAEGDTIRNTTDGSVAVIDEIVDANNITTSPLLGGSDNTWTSGDTYSVHRLGTTLANLTDIVDVPIMNEQTDASGDAEISYPYSSDEAISLRVRRSSSGTRYNNFDAVGTITSAGFSASVLLSEDSNA